MEEYITKEITKENRGRTGLLEVESCRLGQHEGEMRRTDGMAEFDTGGKNLKKAAKFLLPKSVPVSQSGEEDLPE